MYNIKNHCFKLFFKNFSLYASAIVALVSCNIAGEPFSEKEISIIKAGEPSAPMKVLTIENRADSLLLRERSALLSKKEIASATYKLLEKRLVSTVSDSTVDGVGLAAPQVGILKRVVAVQRYDKEGAPFEVYPNIRITEYSAEKQAGREGCLSVPDTNGIVERAQSVVISYTCPQTLKTVNDTVQGYTAVIFQHETDHLDGVLYTDKLYVE